MRILCVLAALLAWLGAGAACASATGDDAAREPEGFVPEARRWDDIMERVVGPIYDECLLREAERQDAPMNLSWIAAQARRAADHMALGYGIHEMTDVPRFGQYAREAEAWLLEVAEQAQAGDTERVRKLILDGEFDHCDRCHAAAR